VGAGFFCLWVYELGSRDPNGPLLVATGAAMGLCEGVVIAGVKARSKLRKQGESRADQP
jgi:hypothetical protein